MAGQVNWCATLLALALVALDGCAPALDDIDASINRNMAGAQGRTPRGRTMPFLDEPPIAPEDITSESALDECVRYALQENEELRAAFHRWQAALERSPQVTALPDPRLSYGYFLNEVETRVGPQQHRFSVSQVFPWFNELDLRGDVAAKAAQIEWDRMNVVRLKIIQAVKERYYELFYLRQAIALARENLDILARFEEIARIRYAVAEGGHPDIVRTQVEIGKLEDRILELEDQRRPLTARLNAALNRPVGAPGPWPAELADPGLEVDHSALVASLEERNPRLAALLSEGEQHRAAAALARTEYYPDLTLMFDYIVTGEAMNPSINESGDDAMIAGVSINVPIWRNKYEAGVREALKRRLATAAQRVALTNTLHADLELALFRYRDAHRKIALYRNTLLPKANESLDAALGGYQGATVPFTDLLDAQRVFLELELAEARARTDAAIAIARIEALIAGELAQTISPSEDES